MRQYIKRAVLGAIGTVLVFGAIPFANALAESGAPSLRSQIETTATTATLHFKDRDFNGDRARQKNWESHFRDF
jgi:hypothetical protein